MYKFKRGDKVKWYGNSYTVIACVTYEAIIRGKCGITVEGIDPEVLVLDVPETNVSKLRKALNMSEAQLPPTKVE